MTMVAVAALVMAVVATVSPAVLVVAASGAAAKTPALVTDHEPHHTSAVRVAPAPPSPAPETLYVA